MQEAFRRSLSAMHKPSPVTVESTRAWLFTIVRNLWHNELRHRSRWAGSADRLDEMIVASESLETQVTRKLLQSEVRHAVDMLPEAHREVIVLRDIEGLSYAEIARILDCPCGTVMSRLARARQTLRVLLCASAPAPREARR